MSEFSTALMNQTLKIAPQFAFTPYPQLLPHSASFEISLFERRRSRFTPEKDLLADLVVKKVSDLIEKDEELLIILILDAGSTVFPIFKRLCIHPSFQFDRTKARRLKIITNNLPGVSDLIRYGRIGDPTIARTLFQCRVLTGFADSQYEACLSNETASDLRKAVDESRHAIKDTESTKVRVVSVTTGNYISISDGILGRDRNHVATKSTMLDVADEMYVLAPLGKLLPYSSSEINEFLEVSDEAGYSTLTNWSEKSQALRMVVTARGADYFPQLRPIVLNTYFGYIQRQVDDRYKDQVITIPFDPRDDVRVRAIASVTGLERALREYELPTQELREKLIYKLQTAEMSPGRKL